MLDPISDLQSAILGAPPEVTVPAGIFILWILIRLLRDLPHSSPAVADQSLEPEARLWIADRIDQHVEILAEAYGEAGMQGEPDDLPPGFALKIESFIAEGLLRELDAEDFDADLRAAVREFAVLQRADIYEGVITRIRQHLAAT